MRVVVLGVLGFLTFIPAARAVAADDSAAFLVPPSAIKNPWRIDWLTKTVPPAPAVPGLQWSQAPVTFTQDPQPLHAVAVEHSDAYQTRAKIHKYASFATLPLFATELWLGQSLYDNSGSDGKKGAHAAVGASIVTLFGVNSVTGLWNMFGDEGRQEKQGRTLRLTHGLLMLAADAGFVATWAAAPGGEGHMGGTVDDGRSTHRALAITSISLGTAGYLIMLLGNH